MSEQDEPGLLQKFEAVINPDVRRILEENDVLDEVLEAFVIRECIEPDTYDLSEDEAAEYEYQLATAEGLSGIVPIFELKRRYPDVDWDAVELAIIVNDENEDSEEHNGWD